MREGPLEGASAGGDGVRLSWRFWLSERETGSIFLVHGLGEHSGRYEELALWLGASGISLFSFDLRGHGRSDGVRGDVPSFDCFLDDVGAMNDVFQGLLGQEGRSPAQTVLMGHSLGGLIVLSALQLRPEIRMGFRGGIVSAPWLSTPLPLWLRRTGRWLGRRLPDLRLPNGLGPHRLTRDPDKVRAWKEDPLVHTRLTARLFREAERVQDSCLGRGADLRGFPLLYLVPEDDPVVCSGTTMDFARGIDDDAQRVEILSDRRHEALNDLDRQEVFETVTAWTTELLSLGQGPTP